MQPNKNVYHVRLVPLKSGQDKKIYVIASSINEACKKAEEANREMTPTSVQTLFKIDVE